MFAAEKSGKDYFLEADPGVYRYIIILPFGSPGCRNISS
jgi:hypothetical protein